MNDKDLIEEARRLENDYGDNYEVVTHMSALADALEAATRERAAVPAEAEYRVDPDRNYVYWRDPIEGKLAEVIARVTDMWDDPLDEVHDIPQIARAVAEWLKGQG